MTVPQWSGICGTFLSQEDRRGENASTNRGLEKMGSLDKSQGSRRGSSDRRKRKLVARRLCPRSTARFNFLGLGKESSVCRDDHSTEIVSNFLASAILHAWALEFLWLNWILLTGTLRPFYMLGRPLHLCVKNQKLELVEGAPGCLMFQQLPRPRFEILLKHVPQCFEPSSLRRALRIQRETELIFSIYRTVNQEIQPQSSPASRDSGFLHWRGTTDQALLLV